MLGPISPLTEPTSSVFHSPLLLQRREKGTCGYTRRLYIRRTENIFVLGATPPRPKQPVVWGTGKKVVYGYSSIQRVDSGTKYVRANLIPHRTPQQCFSLPFLQARPTRPNIEGLWPCAPSSPAWGLSDGHARAPYVRKLTSRSCRNVCI